MAEEEAEAVEGPVEEEQDVAEATAPEADRDLLATTSQK